MARAFYGKATAHETLEEFEDALEAYTKAAEYSENLVRRNGTVDYEKEDDDDVFDNPWAEEHNERRRWMPRALYHKVLIIMQLGRQEEAETSLKPLNRFHDDEDVCLRELLAKALT